MERVGYQRPAEADSPRDWARPEYVTELLGADFELEFLEAICPWAAESGEATWELFIASDGPAKAGVAALPPPQRDALQRDWVAYFERHRGARGVNVPRPYLLTLGRRRTDRSHASSSDIIGTTEDY
jgi:hypothetical protein